jgi:hypothetical protein
MMKAVAVLFICLLSVHADGPGHLRQSESGPTGFSQDSFRLLRVVNGTKVQALDVNSFYPTGSTLNDLKAAIWAVTGIASALVVAALFHTFFEITKESPYVRKRAAVDDTIAEKRRGLAAGIAAFVMLAYFIVATIFSLKQKPFEGDEDAESLFQSPLVTLCSQCGYDNPNHNTTETTTDDAPEFIHFHECIALVVEILCISLILPEVTSAQLLDEEKEQERQSKNWIEKCKTGADDLKEQAVHRTSVAGEKAIKEASQRTIIVASHEDIKYIIQGMQEYQLFQQAKNEHEKSSSGAECIDVGLLKTIQRLGVVHCFLDFVLPVITNLMQLAALCYGLVAYFQRIGGDRAGQSGTQDFTCFLTFMVSMAYFKPILQPWIKLSIWAAKGSFRIERQKWVDFKTAEKARRLDKEAAAVAKASGGHHHRQSSGENDIDPAQLKAGEQQQPEPAPPLLQIAQGMVLILVPLILLPVAMYGANYLTGDRSWGGDEYFAISQWIMWFLNDMWSW